MIPLFRLYTHKKGFFFTLVAIIIVGIFMVIFSFKPYSYDESQEAINARVMTVNAFTHELKQTYLERVLFSTSKAALQAMTDYIRATGARFDDAEQSFASVLTSGSLMRYVYVTRAYRDVRFKLQGNGVILGAGYTSIPTAFVDLGGSAMVIQEVNVTSDATFVNISLYFDRTNATDVYLSLYNSRYQLLATVNSVPSTQQWNTLVFDEPLSLKKGMYFFTVASPESAFSATRLGMYSVAYYYSCCNYYSGTFDTITTVNRPLQLAASATGDLAQPLELLVPGMSLRGKTLNYFNKKISHISTDNLKIATALQFSNISIVHRDPWTLNISMDASIATQRLDTSFNFTTRIATLLPIDGLENPLYAQWGLTSRINRTLLSTWNLVNMKTLLNTGQYRLNNDAPSFFMRFSNSYGSSSQGIENLANVPLSTFGEQPGEHNYSRADWQFFYNNAQGCPRIDLYTFNDLNLTQNTDQFLLDIKHIASFGIPNTTGLYNFYCPLAP